MTALNRLSIIPGSILCCLALMASGCGLQSQHKQHVPKLTQKQLLGGSAPAVPGDYDPNYACADKPNVVPDYDWNLDGSDFFTVCPSRTEFSDILVHGLTKDSDTICIFPAEFVDGNHIYTKPDLSVAGSPIFQCLQSTPAGIFASFPNVNYNAAFIVESQDKDQMLACLVSQNYYQCPHYSFGKFR